MVEHDKDNDNKEKLETIQNALSTSYDDSNALLKLVDDYKFLKSEIVGNRNGLLKLAFFLVKAARDDPDKNGIEFLSVESECNENAFKVGAVARDERLKILTKKNEEGKYEVLVHKDTPWEIFMNSLFVALGLFLCVSLVVGVWTIVAWLFKLF